MDSENDVNKMCRLCLAKDQVDVHIFKEKQIFLKISTCLPVKISCDDTFPKKICLDCSGQLDAMYQFWNKSINSESQLLTWLENLSTDNGLSSINLHSEVHVKEETIDFLKTESDIKTEVMEESYNNESYNQRLNEFPDQESSHTKRKRDDSLRCRLNSNDDSLVQEKESKCVKLTTTNNENLDVLKIIDLGSPRLIYTRSNHFHDMDESSFYRCFRLTKQTCLKVLTHIEEQLELQNDVNRISPMNQLLTTLRFYASCGHFSGMNTTAIMSIILRVSEAIAKLARKVLRMPNTVAEIQQTKNDFFQIAGFPNIIGALGCTHIKIPAPEKDPEIFKNRKSYFSVNVQIVSNANQDMTNIIARWPGSIRDARIFYNSNLRAGLENDAYQNGLLLGYNGFQLEEYLLTPVINPTSRGEELYNEAHLKILNSVEQLLMNWKRRFPVLAYGMRFKKIKTVLMIIVATAALENIAHLTHGRQPPPLPEDLDHNELEELVENGQIQSFFARSTIKSNRVQIRNNVIRDYFHNL